MNERKLTKSELAKREDIIMNMKGNKRDLVKRYGKDAEAVMYGRATNMVKKQSEGMKDPKLTELIKDALKNPKKADLNKDGKLSDYEEKRGAAIEKNTVKEWGSSDQSTFNQSIHKYLGEPTKMPSPFDSILRSAAEDAVDFYWDDWEEYKTNYEGLVDKAVKGYLRSYFSDEFNMMVKMFEPVKEEKRGAAIEKSMTKESIVHENKQEAADELQMIMDQLYELSDQAKMIFRNNFPGEYRRLDAYGALDFGTSSNRYDVTLEGTLENLDMEDDDEDLMEGKDSTHKVKYSKSNDTYQVWLGDEIVTDFATEEKANAEAKRLNALQDAKRIDKAQMQEDMDLGHQDNEPGMLKGDLYKIGKYAMELYKMMDGLEGMGEVDLPHWWQSKITTAKNMISGAKHYLDFELKEPQIDATLEEIGMFNDPIGYEKPEPNPKDLIFTKYLVGTSDTKGHTGYIYDIYKNGVKIKTIKGEGEANAYINQLKREMSEGMSEEEWAKAKEEDRLAKLPIDQQQKIKKAIAMLKAEKKPKK